jgi:predicted GIY-YIG superfamily endonuclease
MKIGEVLIDKNELSKLWSPCVYRVSDANGVLYIGASALGYARVFTSDAKLSERSKAFRECITVSVEFFDNKEEAFEAESKLIHEYHPKHNKTCSECERIKRGNPLLIADEQKRRHLATAQQLIAEFGIIPPCRILKQRGLYSFYYYTLSRPDLFR